MSGRSALGANINPAQGPRLASIRYVPHETGMLLSDSVPYYAASGSSREH
jgi:hypothetical protein